MANAANTTRSEPSASYRWIVLLFLSLAMAGNYYIYDTIAPIADLLTSQLGFTDEQIGWMYSSYSAAAIAFLLIGGVMIDRLGTKKSSMLFAVLCLIGAILTAATPNVWIMASGRFVLGLGAEALIVAITTALAKWFKGKELGFAMGINLLVARLASVAADNSPTWARPLYDNWQKPLYIGIAFGVLCVFGAAIYWILEARAEQRYTLGSAAKTDRLVMRDLFTFSKSYWYIVGLCLVFYSALFPFRSFAIKFFIEGHGASRELGGFLNSVLPLSAMVATPLFGLLVDKVGKRALFMLIGSIVLLPAFLMLTPGSGVNLYLPTILIGVSFSLIPAVMWPAVSYVVEEHRLGSGYALMTLIQQIGVLVLNWLIGVSNDAAEASAQNPGGWRGMLWILSALSVLGVIFSLLLWKTERGPQGHGLETIKA